VVAEEKAEEEVEVKDEEAEVKAEEAEELVVRDLLTTMTQPRRRRREIVSLVFDPFESLMVGMLGTGWKGSFVGGDSIVSSSLCPCGSTGPFR
jgi:hypothetical protein